MWITRKITLLNSPLPSAQRILTRAALAEHQQALSLVAEAEQEAARYIAEARAEADAIIAEARERSAAESAEQIAGAQQAFMTRTDALFADWQQAQQTWESNLLPLAESLLVQAMTQLLDEQPESARLRALLQQLVKVQGRPAVATLLCAPAQQAAVTDWLAQHPDLPWSLTLDATLPPETLVLTTESGELHLSWAQICTALMPV